jgi:ATP-binding cassette subfamily B protein
VDTSSHASSGSPLNPSPADLATLPLFAGLDQASLDEIASWFDVEEHEAEARLTREGSAGYAFYILREGTARVVQGDRELRQLGPGAFFGELSIVGNGHRTASVLATSPVTVWTMFGTRFRELEATYPELAERIRSAYV